MPLLPQLSRAFIYGSVAQGTEHAGRDIDLMLVSDDMSYSDVMELLAPAKKHLGRTINPTQYTIAEFTDRKTNHQPFIQRVGRSRYRGEKPRHRLIY